MNTSNIDDGDVLCAQLLGDDDWLRIDEICARLRVEQQWIIEMVEFGALDPRGGRDPSAWVSSAVSCRGCWR